jgi:hypothetical protein
VETTNGAWCKWYVSNDYILDAMRQLEKGKVRQEYIHIVQLTEHAGDLAKNLFLVVYRNPPYV